jgi:serine/threonine protein kinase
VQRGRVPFDELKPILRDVCAAMSLVHERDLIHRDLKPDNIFLCSTERSVAKVVDFGIAKPVHETAPSFSTHTGYVLGTPAYMSPEQCRGLRDIDRRSDLWSIGVIAYECLVGREPFRAEALAELLLKICMDAPPVPSEQCSVALPVGFDAWFAKAVARERAERFQSADELAAAFTALQGPSTRRERLAGLIAPRQPTRQPDFPSSAPPKTTAERSTPFGLGVVVRHKLEPRIKWSAAAALAVVLIVGGWQLLRLALAPRPTVVDTRALWPEGTPAPAPAAPAPAAPASSTEPSPSLQPEPHALPPQPTPSSPPPASPTAPPSDERSASPKPPPAPPAPPRRRAPATDIRTSR